MKLSKQAIYLILITLAVIISYINIFSNPFVWDDFDFIVNNSKITSLSSISSFFTHPSMNNLWRPLREVLYTITYAIWGLNPFGYHLNAILLHLFITITIFFIVRELTKNLEIAL